jgi:hypothetical protein
MGNGMESIAVEIVVGIVEGRVQQSTVNKSMVTKGYMKCSLRHFQILIVIAMWQLLCFYVIEVHKFSP